MTAATNHKENRLMDFLYRGQTLTPPPTYHIALIRATRGYSNNNRNTAASQGDTIIPATPNGHMYRCTTAGTTGGSEPSWTTTLGGTVNDGTAVWTEMRPDFEAATNLTEVSGGGYARASIAASLVNFSGTQAPGSVTASTGTSGTISNNVEISYPAPTANWGVVVAWLTYGAASGGDAWDWAMLTTPKTINNGDAAPSFGVGNLSFALD